MACDQKAANVAIARIIPVILGGIVVYTSWAVTKQLCIDYLFDPAPRHQQKPRTGAGAGILVIFFILLFPVLACYFRLLHEIIWNPGFIPRGPQWAEQQKEAKNSTRRKRKSRTCNAYNAATEKGDLPSAESGVTGGNYVENGAAIDKDGLESFYSKDVFVCQHDGRPIWCSTCCQFKADRARHCREVGRCVRKMDHFCPWVGGVVSETSFKFFIQFLCYGAIFCGFTLAVVATYVVEFHKKTGVYNVHWLLVLGLSCLFCLFTLAMAGSSLQFAMINSTTVENLSRRKKVWSLAILVPRHVRESNDQWDSTLQTVSYPFPGEFSPPQSRSQSGQQEQSPPERRIFAVVNTRPGENPFDLGGPLANLKEVMGYTALEWLLPLKHSPCTNHSNQESAYALGPAVQRLKQEAGLADAPRSIGGAESTDQRKRRKRRRRSRKDNDPADVVEEEEASDDDQNEPKIQEPAEVHHHHRRSSIRPV